MDEKEKIKILSKVPLFAGLAEEEIRTIMSRTVVETHKPKKTIFFQGDRSDSMHLIVSGTVRVYQVSDRGEERFLRVMGAGEYFGEYAIIDGGERSASVEALEEVTTLSLERADFQDCMRSNPDALWKVAQFLVRNIRRAGQEAMDLSFRNVPYRLLKKLKELATEYGEKCDEGIRLNMSVTPSELANMIGSQPETVHRYISRFSDRKLVVIEKDSLLLPDLVALERVPEYLTNWY